MSWRLAHALDQMQAELDAAFPDRTKPDWTIGDSAHRNRPSDHNPNGAGVVCAIDVRGKRVAKAVWDHIARTRDARVKYMIHDSKIMSSTVSPWTARTYRGSNPHADHIHISVGRGSDGSSTRPDLYDDPSPWGLSEEDDIMIDRNTPLPNPSNAVTKHQNALETWRPGILEQYGADGDFGQETEDAVKAYQKAADLPVTGRIDGVTSALLMEYVRDRAATGGLSRAQADRRYAPKVHDHTGTVTVS